MPTFRGEWRYAFLSIRIVYFQSNSNDEFKNTHFSAWKVRPDVPSLPARHRSSVRPTTLRDRRRAVDLCSILAAWKGNAVKIFTRTLNRRRDRDVEQALSIFRQAYRDAWTDHKLRNVLETPDVCGLLAGASADFMAWSDSEDTGLASGCLIYRACRWGRRILSLGVLQDAAGLGYGTALVRSVQDSVMRMPSPGQREVVAYVGEENLPAQLLFRSCDFLHVRTFRNYYPDGDSAYLLRWAPYGLIECSEAAAGAAITTAGPTA